MYDTIVPVRYDLCWLAGIPSVAPGIIPFLYGGPIPRTVEGAVDGKSRVIIMNV